jgi:hypothetical protein
VVRRSAPLLIAPLWFVAARWLPSVDGDEAALLLAGVPAILLLAGVVYALVTLADVPALLALAGLGVGLTVAALAQADAGAAATPVDASLWALIGVAFAVALDAPALIVALPLFVAGIDVVAWAGDGPVGIATDLARTGAGDPLALDLPALGGGPPVARLPVLDVLFLGAMAAYAQRRELRPGLVVAGGALGLVAALSIEAAGLQAPSLTLMTVGCVCAFADRIPALLGRGAGR